MTPVIPTFILTATIFDATKSTSVYNQDITAGDFNPNDFASLPSGETGTAILQMASTTLRITFSGIITGDTDLQYLGPDPPSQTPQSLNYS